MDILRTLTTFIDRLADVLEAARLTTGQHTVSAERVARARGLMLRAPVETPAARRGMALAPTARRAA